MRTHKDGQRHPTPRELELQELLSGMGAGNWTAHSLTTEPSHKHNFYEHLNQVAAVFTSVTNNWETQP